MKPVEHQNARLCSKLMHKTVQLHNNIKNYPINYLYSSSLSFNLPYFSISLKLVNSKKFNNQTKKRFLGKQNLCANKREWIQQLRALRKSSILYFFRPLIFHY